MIKAEIVADSINPQGDRLTSLLVTMPRFILAEFNTHRMLSKNSASSRAIPFNKMVKSVEENPFIPIAWQKDHKGMQGSDYFNSPDVETIRNEWLRGRDEAVISSRVLHSTGITKQLCNRLLEPFMYHTVLVSGTEWENFFKLRCPQYKFNGKIFRSKKDALIEIEKILGESDFNDIDDFLQWAYINEGQSEIHMMAVAEAIWDAINESTPEKLRAGEWHMPFNRKIDVYGHFKMSEHEPLDNEGVIKICGSDIRTARLKVSTAMCARTSYTVIGDEKEFNYTDQFKLHDTLLKSGHYSPFEHCARVMTDEEHHNYVRGHGFEDWGGTFSSNQMFDKESLGWCNNYRGFIQYRKLIEQ